VLPTVTHCKSSAKIKVTRHRNLLEETPMAFTYMYDDRQHNRTIGITIHKVSLNRKSVTFSTRTAFTVYLLSSNLPNSEHTFDRVWNFSLNKVGRIETRTRILQNSKNSRQASTPTWMVLSAALTIPMRVDRATVTGQVLSPEKMSHIMIHKP
jgi:hypothetical protein